MIAKHETTVQMIPIEQIAVVNPRARGKSKFQQIVANISMLGLKRPITVARRGTKDGQPQYDLVCGQGRIEALKALGATSVPAIVIETTKEDLLLMSLAENLARRRHTTVELAKEIVALKDRGYKFDEIARKTDLDASYVRGIVRLLKKGEERLLQAVERGQIPISIAITIASADDEDVQRALAEAYESKNLRGKALLNARRLIEKRRNCGKALRRGVKRNGSKDLSSISIVRAYKRETSRQKLTIQKSKISETRLLFVVSAMKQLLEDDGFVTLLRAESLDTLPQYLAEQAKRKVR